jgi:hypothetical protein
MTAKPKAHINFEAPAVLRKWPSLRGERRTASASIFSIAFPLFYAKEKRLKYVAISHHHSSQQ